MGPRGLLVEGGSMAAGGRSQGKGKEQEEQEKEQENDMSSNLHFCEF